MLLKQWHVLLNNINKNGIAMKKIIIPEPKSEKLISILGSLYHAFKGLGTDEQVEFDVSKIKWLCPLISLPISAHIHKTGSIVTNENINTKAYAHTIKFPDGVDTVTELEAERQKTKTYVPISILHRDAGVERERLESLFSQMIYQVVGATIGARNAIYYPISELVTNIFEHSEENNGYIFGQYYPTKGHLDMCIVDTGRGLAATYAEEKNIHLSDEEAIAEVMSGHSTKHNKERGYGVRTSKRVVCEALGGSFIIVSGSKALIANDTEEQLIDLKDFMWKGVIIAYRIMKPNNTIDISPYLE